MRRCLAALVAVLAAACAESPTAAPLPAASASPADAGPAVTASAAPTPAPAVTAEFASKGWAVTVTNHTSSPLYLVATWERGIDGGWLEFARRGQVVAPGESARLWPPCSWPGALRAGVLGQPGLHRVWASTSATCVDGAQTN